MRILIDADACPVVDATLAIARDFGLSCLLLCDTAHRFERPGAETVVVDQGADSVDFALLSRLAPGDVVVTQDYGLAAMCLGRGAHPIRQDGLVYDDGNIDSLLLARHTAQRIRRRGGRLKGPRRRTAEEDRNFEKALRALLTDLCGQQG